MDGWMSSPVAAGWGLLRLWDSVVAQFSFGACPSHTVSVGAVPASQFLVGRQSARTQLELAGTGASAPRGREGVKGCCSASRCQAAIRTLRATAALAGLPLPPQRALTSR